MVWHRLTLRVLCACALIAGIVPISVQAESLEGKSSMTVSDGKMVSLEYTLTLEDQAVLDTNVGGAPLNFTQGSHQIIPGLEQALEGMKAGDSKKVKVKPQEGYGEVDPRGIQEIPIEQIPPDARKIGAQLQGKSPEGQVIRSVVREVKAQVVVLDFNHPLAGKTLYFDVTVLDVKAGATP